MTFKECYSAAKRNGLRNNSTMVQLTEDNVVILGRKGINGTAYSRRAFADKNQAQTECKRLIQLHFPANVRSKM